MKKRLISLCLYNDKDTHSRHTLFCALKISIFFLRFKNVHEKLNVVFKSKVLEFLINSYMIFNYTSTMALINQKKILVTIFQNILNSMCCGIETPYTILGQSSLCKCFF